MADAEISSFKVDYAASGRSTCNRCRTSVAEKELRIGPMVQSTKGDFKYPAWHHFSCFEDGWLKKNPGVLKDTTQVSGIDRIKFEDQKRIKSLVVAGDSTLERKPMTDEEKRLAAESKLVWNRSQQLEKLQNQELQTILTANKQPCSGKIFGGRNNMVARAAEGMVFGALAPCSICKGDLYFSHGEYKCTGNIDEYAKCEWKGTDATRTAFVIPDELREDPDYPFLKSYKFKEREKATTTITGSNPTANPQPPAGSKRTREQALAEKTAGGEAAAPSTAADPDEVKTVAVGCFVNCLVTCVGKLSRTQKAIESLITDNGGTFSKTVNADICVMTPAEACGNGTKKGADAVKQKLLCVSEGWVDETLKAGRRLTKEELAPFVLANPRGEVDVTRQHRAELGEKADLVATAQKQRELLEEKYSNTPAGGANKSTGGNKSTVKKVVVKGSSAVDEESGLVDDGHILEEPGGETFNAMLNLADVTTGQNSFYVLQVIEHDSKSLWTTFRRWGKLGNDAIGGTKGTNYPSKAAAIREFKKVFFEKTANEWDQRKKFKRVYGKHQMIDVDFSGGNSDGNAAGAASGAPSSGPAEYNGALSPAVRDFVSLIFDIKVMNDALKELEIDTEKMPLGKLSKATIQQGFAALSDLQAVLETNPDAANSAERSKVVSCSNRFYSYIPHVAPVGKTLPMLTTTEDVKAKTEMLQTLSEMEVASKLMSTAGAMEGEHPLDTHYNKLKTDLNHVPKGTDLFTRINAYLQNTHGATHTTYSLELTDLFEMTHEGDDAKFAPHAQDPNRMLLWHGSRLTNWVGIISQGLRIAPPEAPSTGYMFGKGAYFADMSSKSANYCFTSSDKTTGILMLCEVALGTMKERKGAFFETEIPNKKHQSTFGMGRNYPDPKGAFHEDSGCVIPMGKGVPAPVQGSTLLYNEFIVYNTAQVRPRYLLRLNFNYNKKCGTFF